MASATVFTSSGSKSTKTVALPKDIFDLKVENPILLKQAYRVYLANARMAGAKTLTRGEVRGGGKKPWRQKGTGRARVGSRRNPIWRGGGVAFGPTGEQNFSLDMPKKAKRLAICQALSVKAADGAIKIIEKFFCPDGKVKQALELLNKLEAKRRVLIVVSTKDDLIERATRNIPNVKAVQANYLNVFDIINADSIVISQEALATIESWLGEGQNTAKTQINAEAKATNKRNSKESK